MVKATVSGRSKFHRWQSGLTAYAPRHYNILPTAIATAQKLKISVTKMSYVDVISCEALLSGASSMDDLWHIAFYYTVHYF